MIQQLSPRDWEILSAYLDRQLKPKEVASLEARLSANPDLSAALGELQRTRDALRSLPRMRAPRNFTLTPQMVGQRSALGRLLAPRSRPAARLAPVFGFASALATFLLVLVLVGDWLGILTPSTGPVAQAPVRTSEFAVQNAAAATPEAPAAKLLGTAPQPTVQASLDMQAEQADQTLPETTPMTLTVGAVAPSALGVETSAYSETVTAPLTMTAKAGAGMGAGEPTEPRIGLFAPESMVTPENPVWITTIQVTISPTETLSFPMTVTLDGVPITGTLQFDTQNEQPLEQMAQPEPTSTATPEPPAAPLESPSPVPTNTSVPTNTPAEVAHMVETPTSSQPELPAKPPAPVPSPTLAPGPQPARSGLPGLRILEIMLAALALAAGLAAGIFWWSKRF
jgi:anti-sigma factor RsiW